MLFLLMLRGVAHPSFARPPKTLSYPGTVGLILGSTPLHAYLLRAWGWVLERPPPTPSRGRPLPPPSRSCELTGVALQNTPPPARARAEQRVTAASGGGSNRARCPRVPPPERCIEGCGKL